MAYFFTVNNMELSQCQNIEVLMFLSSLLTILFVVSFYVSASFYFLSVTVHFIICVCNLCTSLFIVLHLMRIKVHIKQ